MSGPDPGKGLLAPGTRSGAEPVTFSAIDNSGIRSAEILDVTDAANPTVVASEDYNTDAGARCDYTRPRPCPDVRSETLAAPTPIAGHRTLLVRVTDAGGIPRSSRRDVGPMGAGAAPHPEAGGIHSPGSVSQVCHPA